MTILYLTKPQRDRLKLAATRDLTQDDRGWRWGIVISNLMDRGLVEGVILPNGATVWRITEAGKQALNINQ